MKTISQRELRNDNAEIIRGVEAGETYVVTKRGVPVARVVPYVEDGPGLRVDKPATRRIDWTTFPRVTMSRPSQEILDELREEREL